MEKGQLEFFNTCIVSLILGIILGVVFDLLSFLEIYVKNLSKGYKIPWTITFSRDITFSITSTVLFILLLYYFNTGIFRGAFLISVILGFSVYIITARKIVLIILKFVSKALQKILGFLLQPIAKLIIRLYNKCKEKSNKHPYEMRQNEHIEKT